VFGKTIRRFGRFFYEHPTVPQDVVPQGSFGQLKIALVADYFTSICLSEEARVRSLTPDNYQEVLTGWKPDLVFVESAFHGVQGEWRYGLAKQPKYIRLGQPQNIRRLVQLSRDLKIPTLFWNKDDDAFFEAFIDVACLFPHVFTTDNRCVPRYRAVLPLDATVQVLTMPFQPAFHNFTGFHFQKHAACFVGSYYRRILQTRRSFLDMIFTCCEEIAMPLHVFDRNNNRLSHFLEFRFPQKSQLRVHSRVPYPETSRIYKTHAISLNVNSIVDSETMCSRRLLEIMACGGIAVTNASLAVKKHFQNFCHVLTSKDQAIELFDRLRFGPSKEDQDRAAAGASYVHAHHSWECRLEQIAEVVSF